MNFLYGRTLFISVFVIFIFLNLYTYSNYSQLYDVPLYLSLSIFLLIFMFIILAVLRCHAIGWSGWRVVTIILPFVKIVLLFSLMYLPSKKPSNKINPTA